MAIGSATGSAIQTGERAERDTDLQDLVGRAGRGDLEAFRELHGRYHDRLYAYVYFRTGDAEDALDAVQDVFVGVWRGLPGFEYHHAGSFPGWLFGIARNVVASRARRMRRRPVAPVEEVPEQPFEFEGELVSRRVIVDMLRRLPDLQREVVVLRFLLGLSLAQVAASISRSESAVVQLQLRGLRRLRKELTKE
jgi:RNA polymerase sigma-70 factor (ECF subfamily)